MNEFLFYYVQAPWDIPNSRSYLTPGKIYKVLSFDELTPANSVPIYNFRILDDNGVFINCVQKESTHLSGKDWIVFDYKKNLEKVLE